MALHKTKFSIEIEKCMLMHLITTNNKTENKHTHKVRLSMCFCICTIKMPLPLLHMCPLPATIAHFSPPHPSFPPQLQWNLLLMVGSKEAKLGFFGLSRQERKVQDIWCPLLRHLPFTFRPLASVSKTSTKRKIMRHYQRRQDQELRCSKLLATAGQPSLLLPTQTRSLMPMLIQTAQLPHAFQTEDFLLGIFLIIT